MFLPTSFDVDTALNVDHYDATSWANSSSGLRSNVESNLHNVVHRWAGGTMGMMTSPNDPVFWLHHCNIDRLWAVWHRVYTGAAPYLPVSGAALGHNLMDAMIFSDHPPAPWSGTWIPASVVDTTRWGTSTTTSWSLDASRCGMARFTEGQKGTAVDIGPCLADTEASGGMRQHAPRRT